MSIRRVVPDVSSERFDESRQFYVDVLGFEVVMVTWAGFAGRHVTEARRISHVPQHQDAS